MTTYCNKVHVFSPFNKKHYVSRKIIITYFELIFAIIRFGLLYFCI